MPERASTRPHDADVPRPLAVDIKTACAMSDVGRTSLYEEMRAGRLRARKYRRRTLIEVTELERWLAAPDEAS